MSKISKLITLSLISILSFSQIRVQAYEDKYKEIKEYKTSYFRAAALEYEREELRISREANENFSKRELKTDSNYEIALAYSDGSYSYLDKADTIEEAMTKCIGMEEKNKSLNSPMPVVLDKSGQAVYAEKSVGRVRKYVDGVAINNNNLNSNVYSSATLTNAYTYVNHGYVSEVPLIGTSGNAANVLIGGYKGWMSYRNDLNNLNSDIVIWPLNQVTNPSYYKVENGVLIHYISLSLDTPNSGVFENVGKAPDFLVQGKKYISYDGIYFYDGANPQDGIWNLTLDLRENTKNRSLNKNNPYYSYTKNLPFRTKTNYNAQDLDNYINSKTQPTSKLRGLGKTFKECEEKYGVNATIALGVAINESGWGMSAIAQQKNNLFGLNAVDSSPGLSANEFATPEDSVRDFTKNWISNGYTNPRDSRNYGGFLGDKEFGANVKYASDPFWGEKAANFAFSIDYELSGKNINSLKDENYYQLIKYTGPNKVIGPDGVWFYDIAAINTYQTSTIGTIAAMVSGSKVNINGTSSIEIYAERNHSMNDGNFTGDYDWNYTGYVEDKNYIYINKGRTRFEREDFDEDGKITLLDLAQVGNRYNLKSGDKNWDPKYDINNDNIIDIYDIVNVARKI